MDGNREGKKFFLFFENTQTDDLLIFLPPLTFFLLCVVVVVGRALLNASSHCAASVAARVFLRRILTMSHYQTSSQKRNWILTPEDVERRRSEVRAKAIESAKEARLSTGEPLQGNAKEALTDEEETLLRRYYEVGGGGWGLGLEGMCKSRCGRSDSREGFRRIVLFPRLLCRVQA